MTKKVDVCIVGGGLVGGVMAIDLARRGFHVVVVDQESPEAMLNPAVDGRTTAVNLGSQRYFSELGLWQYLASEAERINDIRVYEGGSPWSIHFDHKEMGAEPMGYIIDNRFIRQAIIQRALDYSTLHWLAPTQVLAKKINQQGVQIFTNCGLEKSNTEHPDGDYDEIHAQLLICAEGRKSPTRSDVGIKTYEFPYKQKALVFSVHHEHSHQNVAWEVFYPQGPLAFLPAKSADGQSHRSGIVWTLPPDEADYWAAQEMPALEKKLQDLFPHFGTFTICTKVWCYPLSAQMVDRFIDQRMVIIGDAAHVCHPVAGQGVNVGWRDAMELGAILSEARALGGDLGSQSVLSSYQRARRLDTYSIFAMTDGMVRLFSNDSHILGFLRNGGLGVVNRISPLKKFFMKRAMGV